MTKLSREARSRARAYIYEHGRPLEQAKYAVYFEGESRDEILDELEAFQNPDGGFGHGMEPDLRLPASSVLATTVGLQVLREFGAEANHPLVEGAMGYLMSVYDAERRVWPFIPPTTEEAPHAPWWTYSETIADNWGGYLANPRAEIVGYLYDYPELVPQDLKEQLLADLIAYLDDHPEGVEMHELLCFVRLAESRGLPVPARRMLLDKLVPLVDRLVPKDPEKWGQYGLTPLEVVESPDSAFAEVLAAILPLSLDYEIAHQAASGAWEPKWTWGDLYPEAWEQAKRDWSGVITVRTLKILQAFDRLEA